MLQIVTLRNGKTIKSQNEIKTFDIVSHVVILCSYNKQLCCSLLLNQISKRIAPRTKRPNFLTS